MSTTPDVTGNAAVPINNLPDELLGEVFRIALETTDTRNAKLRFLLTITSVCSIWRHVALDLPTLWTYITQRALMGVAKNVSRLEAFLERSMGCLLDVEFHFTEDLSSSLPYIEALDTHAARLKRLSLRIAPRHSEVATMLLPLRWHCPSLEWLHLEAPSFRPVVSSLFADSFDPPLRVYELRSPTQSHLRDYPPARLLKRLDLGNYTADPFGELAPLLSQCIDLEELSLQFTLGQGPGGRVDDIHPVTLPRLRVLSVMDSVPLKFPHVINTPALRSLRIDVRDAPRPDPGEIPFWPHLEDVFFSGRRAQFMGRAHMLAFLAANPSITRLSFFECHLVEALRALVCWSSFPDDLRNEPADPAFLVVPALTQIHVRNSVWFGPRSDYSALATLVTAFLIQRPGVRMWIDRESWKDPEKYAGHKQPQDARLYMVMDRLTII